MDIQRVDVKQRIRRRRLIAIAGGGAIILALIFILLRLGPSAPRVPRSSLWVDTVKRGEMIREVRGTGTLVPKEIRWIAAETSARVERILIQPGALVSSTTVIMELSNAEVVDQQLAAVSALTAAEADYTVRLMTLESQSLDQRANLAGAKAAYESARLQAEAERKLAESGIISRIQSQRSELASEQLALRVEIEKERAVKFEKTVQAQLTADRTRIDQLRNAADLRRRQVGALSVRAGIAGILQQLPVQEGQQVASGTNLARVAKLGELMAELRVPETQIKDVALGQQVRVDIRDGMVDGHVVRIDPAVQNGAVLVEVEFTSPLPASARPDLSVDGTIKIERLQNVMYIGRPAYGQPGTDTWLFRVNSDGIANRVPVRLGQSSISQIEVVKGLNEGDEVVLSDMSQWEDYSQLRVN